MSKGTSHPGEPIFLNAQVTLRPTSHLLNIGPLTEAKSIEAFLEERYPGWKQEFLAIWGAKLGIEEMMNLSPVAIASLGIIYSLMKERKI